MTIIFDPGILRELFGKEFNQIDTLPIDITNSEKISEKKTITDKPVENGDTKTIGSVRMPTSVSISGIFLDTRGGMSWADKLQMLMTIYKNEEPFTVVTSIAAYDSMIIESIDFSRDVSNKGYLVFDAVVREINVIRTKIVALPSNFKKNANARDLGKKQPEVQTKDQAERQQRTIAAYGYDKLFGD